MTDKTVGLGIAVVITVVVGGLIARNRLGVLVVQLAV
jgi:hypothetical protein